jgi:hypothetical protein
VDFGRDIAGRMSVTSGGTKMEIDGMKRKAALTFSTKQRDDVDT